QDFAGRSAHWRRVKAEWLAAEIFLSLVIGPSWFVAALSANPLQLPVNLDGVHKRPLVAIKLAQLAVDRAHVVDRLRLETTVRATVGRGRSQEGTLRAFLRKFDTIARSADPGFPVVESIVVNVGNETEP